MPRALGLVPVLLLPAVMASAQTPPRLEQLVLKNVVSMPQESSGNARPDDVIARMLAFDLDGDGRVALRELPERMQPLVARGDADHDNALDLTEIRTLASGPAFQQVTRPFPHPGGGYGFSEEDSVSSLSHVVGAFEDLRLASATQNQARPIVVAFAEALDADARTTLLGAMDRLLSTDQAADFRSALDPRNAKRVFFSADAKQTPQVLMFGPNLARRIEQYGLAPAQRQQALAAIGRFKSQLRVNESDRSMLLEQIKGLLSDEECDNFRAALERRPLTKAGGVMSGVVGGVVGTGRPVEMPTGVRPAILVN